MIKLENIKFKYQGQSTPTLDIASFGIQKGEKVFLFGPSGCGKTTLLEILSGVLISQTGDVNIMNTNLAQLSNSARDQFRANHIGYIFQSFNLIPYLNVEENITLPLSLSAERRKRIPLEKQSVETKRLCEHLGISDFLHKNVSELSVGQQQRVAVARALIGAPELILADEPTSSLDFDHREKFIKLLFHECAQNKTTVLFVSHDRTLEKLFDQSISLKEINLASFTSTEEVGLK
jgi:putative ABC transport system ATP-binding protein